jgi:RHS repeat-associated protein
MRGTDRLGRTTVGRRRAGRFGVAAIIVSLLAGLAPGAAIARTAHLRKDAPASHAAPVVPSPEPAQVLAAVQGIGGQLYATGGRVEVQVLPASALYTSELWLFEPGTARRIATNRDVGLVVDLGTFPAGAELVFGVRVLNTGKEYRMGPGSRNPDGIAHAAVTFLDATKAQVGFEDQFGGGDRDYNDTMFEFRGGIAPEAPKEPTAAAGPDQTVTEGALVTLDGTGSTNPAGSPLTYAWTLIDRTGPPVVLSSATSPTPTFATTDDGTYHLRLTVANGSLSASDEVTVTVGNAIPVLAATADPAYANSVALLTTSFTDAGILDTHAGTVDWGDGSAPDALPATVEGAGWGSLVASHVYTNAGAYPVTITITDDDGGSATTTVASLSVLTPVALWANSNAADTAMETTSGSIRVEGLTHTNDDLRIRGGAKTFVGPTEYVRTLDVGGAGATFNPTPVRTTVKPYPVSFDIATYRPGGKAAIAAGPAYHDMSGECGADAVWHATGSVLASGIYYASCAVHLNGSPLGGTITLAAEGPILVSGSGAFFDPYTDGLLFLTASSAANAIKIDAANSTFFGYTFAGAGRIALTGSSDRFYCGILGDQIDIAAQNLLVHGAACSTPARTVAPPVLVPTLGLSLAVDKADAEPSTALLHTATVTSTGATLLVPGILGLENLGTGAATVTGHELALEYLAADGAWTPLPGTITTTVRPNPAAGVTYPSGDVPIDGTTIPAGALGSWGYAAVVTLDAAQIALLLDPARAQAIRVRSTFALDPPTVPVRRLFRFGDDIAGALRAQGSTATDLAVTVIPPAGDARTFTASGTPGLASLAPGEHVTVSLPSTVPAPAARSADETDAAYLARLDALDGTPLTGLAFARGGAAIGPILAPGAQATTTRHLPVVGLTTSGPDDIVRGTTAAYTLALANTGSSRATAITLADALAGVGTLPVTGAPATLDPDATATAHATYAVPAGSSLTTLDDLGTVTWKDVAGNSYGPLNSRFLTKVLATRRLAVTKAAIPVDGSEGTALDYEIAVSNTGDQPISGAALADTPDAHTAITAGSVTTTLGAVTAGNAAGDPSVAVTLGAIAPRSTAIVRFRVTIGAIPDGVTAIANQATVTADGLDPVLSDDPTAPGAADPTVTPVGPTAGGGGTSGAGPTAGAFAPADGTIVTTPVTLAATLTPTAGTAVASWRITATAAGSGGATTLASGDGGALDAPVPVSAAFDPTRLPNGTYVISLHATGSDGGVSTSTTSLIVDGNLKLGRFTTTYQDLSVGVGGLPMQVLRTYDSFDKTAGDFGVGWRVGLANFRVQVNRPLGAGGWSQSTAGCGMIFCTTAYRSTAPHFVTVVWPDGHTEIFDLAPRNGSTFFASLTEAAFAGRARATSKLEALDNSLSYFGDGNLYGGGFGSGGVYDPARFRLTAKDGTVYILDRTAGLVSATDRNGNTLTVDAAGIHSSLGPSITFTRDAQSRITRVTDPAGACLTYSYSAAGDLASVTDQTGKVLTFEYLAGHYLDRTKDGAGNPIRTLVYDADGRLVSISDGAGNTTAIDVDPDARTETVTSPDGRLTTISTFDTWGDPLTVARIGDGRTLTAHFTYDALGHVTSRTDPAGHVTRATYNAAGSPLTLTEADGGTTTFTYNSYEQLTSIKDRTGRTIASLTYDNSGNLATKTTPDGDSLYTYGSKGLLATSIDPAGHTSSYAYDAAGHVTSVTGPDGRVWTYAYDGDGRTSAVTDPAGQRTTFSYDAAGDLAGFSDAAGRGQAYAYDSLGRLATVTDGIGHATTYSYDDAGRLASVLDRNGVTTNFTSDAASQVTRVTLPDGSTHSFTYDAFGQLVEADNADAKLTFTYDTTGNLVSQTSAGTAPGSQPTVALTLGRDAAGRPTTLDAPWGQTSFGYDDNGLLARVTDPAGGAFSLAHDPLGRLASLSRPNGVTDSYAYTSTGQLASRSSAKGGSAIDALSYTHDTFGRVAGKTDASGATAYGYDAADRLISVLAPAGSSVPNEAFTYDPSGNQTQAGGTYDAANRLRSDARFTYSYDGEGDQTRKTDRSSGAVTTYAWNALHELTGATLPDGSVVHYRYDALGRRIEMSSPSGTTRYVNLGANVLAEYDGTNSLQASYVTMPANGTLPGMPLAVTAGTTTRYPLLDSVGSVSAFTDSVGSVSSTFSYSAYGVPQGASSGTYAYGTYGYDAATGLYYARARYYDPGTGRFLSEDPIPTSNLYTYAAGSPVAVSDPSGLCAMVEYSETTDTQTAANVQRICAQGTMLAGNFQDIATDIAFTAIDALAQSQGLYAFVDSSGATYVGQSVDIRRRILEHLRADRLTRESRIMVLELQNMTKSALRQAEQLAIRDCGGKELLANKINALNIKARTDLEALYRTLGDFLR